MFNIKTILYKIFIEKFIRYKNSRKSKRFLEIGPGIKRIENFEGLNIVKNNATDYIADVAKGIPFANETFDLIYSSHFLEHIEWYNVHFVLKEMYRVLKPNGIIEIYVPNGLKIAKAFVEAELYDSKEYLDDNWWKFNKEKDPCIWANGRIFTYGDGKRIKGHWNSHLSIFSERYLKKIIKEIGFSNIEIMDNTQCRGDNHGWINLGIRAIK